MTTLTALTRGHGGLLRRRPGPPVPAPARTAHVTHREPHPADSPHDDAPPDTGTDTGTHPADAAPAGSTGAAEHTGTPEHTGTADATATAADASPLGHATTAGATGTPAADATTTTAATATGASATASQGGDGPGTPIPLQLNALQAMCRQVFGFRLAMIALAAPAALLNASPGLGVRLVGAAVVVTFMGSYVLFRDWERFGALLLRHPTLLAVDTLFGSLLLVSAGPDTTLAYVSVCTPLLAGIVYGWRGAACFASLQSLILLLVYAALKDGPQTSLAERLLLPGLCVITGAMGSTLRSLMLRFGSATQALSAVRARLAATEAVAAERARLAREMHDSVAKTLHGLALAAEGLARSAGAATTDPERVRQQADLVARAARRAAAESRELLTDLRRDPAPARSADLLQELSSAVAEFTARTGRPATFHPPAGSSTLPVPPPVARQLRTIASEALDNAHRHADPRHVEVRAEAHDGLLRLSVRDDGPGLPPGTTLERLRRDGHFGLVGMAERAASLGARLHIGRGPAARGTEIRLELPLDPPPPEQGAGAHRP
ncbi:sensor histidine kinase [Streptomyces sp. NPDC017936]|uniref:sensor histidine kinase n=1 Tax=Streptomyces sp. NPDC017936 TaxID=3365016 RepID=UPI0037A6C399